jgi:hypothetical protein
MTTRKTKSLIGVDTLVILLLFPVDYHSLSRINEGCVKRRMAGKRGHRAVREIVTSRHKSLTVDSVVRYVSRNEPLIHTSCPAVPMPALDQAQSPVSRNLHKTEIALTCSQLLGSRHRLHP